ncbi:energy transducer TonB [Flavobacterium hauense]
MKAATYLIILLLFTINVNAQAKKENQIVKGCDATIDQDKDAIVYPQYPDGGVKGFESYLNKKLDKTKANGKVKKSRIYVTLQVEKDGTVSDAKIMRNIDFPDLNNEILKALKLSPKWTPATKKGIAVKSPIHLPLTISI